MKIKQTYKEILGRLGKGTALVLVGVAIGVLMIVMRHQSESADLEGAKLKYTVNYIKTEQAQLGIDCHALHRTLQEFLTNDVQPILKRRYPGEDWSRDVSQDTLKRMGEMRDYYLDCGRLYRASQIVQWDGFNDLDFAIKYDREMITLDTLLRFSKFGARCDASCLDDYFRELQISTAKIKQGLQESNQK